MIKSLHVRHFRCFEAVDLPDLRRINVIVGKNASGKTSLLEALRLALTGTPATLWAMNQLRSQFIFAPQPTREQFEALWNPYFFRLDASQPIVTECTDSDGRTAKLRIFFDPQKSITAVPPVPQQQPGVPQQPGQAVATIIPLAFERVDLSGQSSTIYASVNPQGGYQLEPGPELGSVIDFPPAWAGNPQQAAQWFSVLAVHQREKEIVDAVREAFELQLEDLTVLNPNQVPAIYASVRYLKERVPLTLVSAGVTRFVALLAAISIRPDGVLLIDEIENGLFYKTLPSLWRYLLKFAARYRTQVFASTHSQECVRALGEAMKGQDEEFALLRTERANGSTKVTLLGGKTLEAAIDQGVEIR